MATSDPVPPFSATVDGAAALVPEATLPEALGPGERGVTVGQVAAWVASLSGRLEVRLTGWRRLRDVPTDEETAAGDLAPRDRLRAAAADLVHNGAASYLEAARFPERAAQSDTSYAAVLWARFVEGEDLLATWLEAELDTDGAGDGDVVDLGLGGIGYSFPAASFTPDTMRW